MAQVRTDARPWIHQRCCPRCGYGGWELQSCSEEAPYECPNCDEDLYARRPLTYAEREGFVPIAQSVPHVPGRVIGRSARFWRAVRGLGALVSRLFR